MTINTVLLKEKDIIINQFVPATKMQIAMNRLNMMPEKPNENNLQCELKLTITIEDEEKKKLAEVSIGFVVVAILNETDGIYNQSEFADRLFNVLQPMYIAEANNLLLQSRFPPIPMNIKC